MKRYYKRNSDNDIYFTGKDQKNQYNLINIRTGSEMFVPGYYESEVVEKNMHEISKEQALREVPNAYGNHSN